MDIKQIRLANLREVIAKETKISDFAERSGISPSMVSQYTSETRGLGDTVCRRIEAAYGLGHGWMDQIHNQEQHGLPPGANHLPVTVWDDTSDLDPSQHVIVPRVQVRFAAGNGHEVSFEPDTHDKGNAYRLDWIRRKGLDPKRLIVVMIDGDSMAPTLPHGSAMTTDMRKNTLDQVIDGWVYAIRYGNELRVKRLRKRFDGALLIDSDNPAYQREVVEPHQLEHIGIIGAYVAHSYDGEI